MVPGWTTDEDLFLEGSRLGDSSFTGGPVYVSQCALGAYGQTILQGALDEVRALAARSHGLYYRQTFRRRRLAIPGSELVLMASGGVVNMYLKWEMRHL